MGGVVVNVGKSAGVSVDTRLVLVLDYDEMSDADGESLGRILNPKADLSVVSVDERFCVTYPVTGLSDTLRSVLPFLSVDQKTQPKVGDDVVFAADWDIWVELTGDALSSLGRCPVCEERLGVVVSCESFFGCAGCEADLSSYNMIESDSGDFLRLLCAVGSVVALSSTAPVRVGGVMAMNLGRVAGHRVVVRWGVRDSDCADCGRGISSKMSERYGMGGRCFTCLVECSVDGDVAYLSPRFLRLMYWVVMVDCIHDAVGVYSF